MKITFFGTAAAEGVPALFCKCETCTEARVRGGRNIRTRTQALVNDDLLIDLPGDTYFHFIKENYCLADIENLIVTHSHSDHFYPEDLVMRFTGYANSIDNQLTVYGNPHVHANFDRAMEAEGKVDEARLAFQPVVPFTPFRAGKYEVTPLVADHDKREECLVYELRDGNKTLLYGHDSGYFPTEVWAYWEATQPRFDLVTLDCTNQLVPSEGNHMSFMDNVKVKEEMIRKGYASDATIFIINHFSHNGKILHEEMSAISEEKGFITAYDGMVVEF